MSKDNYVLKKLTFKLKNIALKNISAYCFLK